MTDNSNLRNILATPRSNTASTSPHPTLVKDIHNHLSDRFFFNRRSGGQDFYYDTLTEDVKLTKQHLIPVVVDLGITDFGWAKKIIDTCNFKPIVLEPKYVPNAPKVVQEHSILYPNLWRKPDVEPDFYWSSPFVAHLELMLGTPEKAQYVINYLALRYQYPQLKPHIAFYFYHDEGGYGKSMFAETLEAVFGKSAVMSVPDQSALNSKSAIDIWKRTWLVVQEVDVKRGSTNYNLIKTMTGGNSFDGERKNEHFRTHKTPAQLIMLSNSPPNFLEQNDRRFFVSEWHHDFGSAERKQCYFEHYNGYLKRDGGYSAIAKLLATTDVSGIELAAAAMMTPEKARAIGIQADQATTEIKDRIEDNPNQRLFTESEFADIFQRNGILANAIKHKLAAAGLVKAADCFKDKDPEGKNQNMYFWHRSEDNISRCKGKPAQIIHGSTKWESLVKDDEGYKKELTRPERGWV